MYTKYKEQVQRQKPAGTRLSH